MSDALLFPFADILANETFLIGRDAMPAELVAALDHVSYYDFGRSSDSGVERLWFTLVIDSEIGVSAPGLPSLRLVVAGSERNSGLVIVSDSGKPCAAPKSSCSQAYVSESPAFASLPAAVSSSRVKRP